MGASPSGDEGDPERGVRARVLAAMAEAVADRGYARTTVEDVLRRAGMSRRTFYGQFRNREECFLAAYDAVHDGTMTRIAATHGGAGSRWPAHVQDALTAVLEYLAARPAFARLFVVEALAAGSPGIERHERTMREFAARLADSRPGVGADPDLAVEASVGAVHRVVHARIVDGRAGELPALAPQLTTVVRNLARPGGKG